MQRARRRSAPIRRTGVRAACAHCRARRPQPDAPSQRWPARGHAELRRRRLLPVLLAAVKLGVALLLARLAWRFVRAHAAARAGAACAGQVGSRPAPAPRVRIDLSPRLWLAAFLATSLFYLVQHDAEQASVGRWPLLSPWLHTLRAPVFAVLAVLVALAWSAVASWLAEYERYAKDACARAERLARRLAAAAAASAPRPPPRRRASSSASPSRAGRLRCPRSPRSTPSARGPRRRCPTRGEVDMSTQLITERVATRRRSLARASRRCARARWPMLGGVVWAFLAAVPDHAAAPARPGLLVAARPSRRCWWSSSASSSRSFVAPGVIEDLEAEER